MVMPDAPDRPRIYSHLSKSRFLHFEDALTLDSPKIRIFAGEFTRGSGMKYSAYHFLDVDDARVLFADLAEGRPVDFKDYKGGPARLPTSSQAGDMAGGPISDGKIISRVLKVNMDGGKVWFQVSNGPGLKIEGGAVKPLPPADAEIPVGMDLQEARKLAYAVLSYLQAWDVMRLWKRYLGGW